MGLSGVKNKTKLSHDPNNTNWSKSTTNFGHKILSAQGWKPGDYLGAENAAHSSHYTAANASHIRVVLREENQGIGAQIGKGNAETFGLSMFSGLLGRLNGKSEAEVEKSQNAIRDVELKVRYGGMNFVSGGLLVGDKMVEDLKSTVLPGKRKAEEVEGEEEEPKVKKAKQSEDVVEEKREEETDVKQRKKKRSKEQKERESQAKKSLKAAKKAAKFNPEASAEKARLKAEKRLRKEERRARKEQKRARRAAKAAPEPESESGSGSDGTATPPVPASAVFGGRHAVRQRYIQQKRLASMDPKALKEIFRGHAG